MRKDAVRLAVAGDQRDGGGYLYSRPVAAGRAVDGEQKVRLAVSGQPGKPDDLSFSRDELLGRASAA